MSTLAPTQVYSSSIDFMVFGLASPANLYRYFRIDIYEVLWGNRYYVKSLHRGPYYHTEKNVALSTDYSLYFSKQYSFQVFAQWEGVYYQCDTGYLDVMTAMESGQVTLTNFSDVDSNNVYQYLIVGFISIYGYEIQYSVNGGAYQVLDCGIGSPGGVKSGSFPFAFPADATVVLQARGYTTQKSAYTAWGNVKVVTTHGARPSNFTWTNAKTKDGDFNLSASEWNALATKINAFRVYKKLPTYDFTTAYIGANYEAYYFKQAVTAISAMSPPTSLPSTVTSGAIIYASQLNGLVSSLNSIT